MVDTILSANLYIPKKNNMRKQIMWVKDSGTKFLIIVPKNRDIAKIELQITFIIVTDKKGIFTLLVPYAKLATKASMESAVTIIIDSNIHKS